MRSKAERNARTLLSLDDSPIKPYPDRDLAETTAYLDVELRQQPAAHLGLIHSFGHPYRSKRTEPVVRAGEKSSPSASRPALRAAALRA